MDAVGEKFKNGEIFVPEMLVAARAMKKGVEVLDLIWQQVLQALPERLLSEQLQVIFMISARTL